MPSLKAFFVNRAKLGEDHIGPREFCRGQILMQVGDRRGAGDQKNVGCTMQQPGCVEVAPSRAATSERGEDWRGVNPPRGKKGT